MVKHSSFLNCLGGRMESVIPGTFSTVSQTELYVLYLPVFHTAGSAGLQQSKKINYLQTIHFTVNLWTQTQESL